MYSHSARFNNNHAGLKQKKPTYMKKKKRKKKRTLFWVFLFILIMIKAEAKNKKKIIRCKNMISKI